MEQKSAIMLRVLMNRYHQGAPDVLLAGLPKDDAADVLAQNISSSDASKILQSPVDLLGEKIHYSWLVPVLETFSKPMQSFLISALPQQNAQALSHLMKRPLVPTQATSVREYLLSLLCQKFSKRSVMPIEFLPETSLTKLGTLNKAELIELIDYLGLFDLAEELRYIVDNVLVKSIYNCLSPKKQHFLRASLHKKEKLKAGKIGLMNWKGDRLQLERLLHRRGLLRFSYALAGQNKDFVWHIVHRLDVGRGHLIGKYYSSKEFPGVTAFLCQQVLNTLNFLNKTSSK
ncbi:MAG: hypothetical protein ACXWM7_01775 [Parachlamydiaceae bacterium]